MVLRNQYHLPRIVYLIVGFVQFHWTRSISSVSLSNPGVQLWEYSCDRWIDYVQLYYTSNANIIPQSNHYCKALLPVAELNIALVSIDPDNPIMLKGDPANPPAADVEFC